jgi:hypothetical protein
MKFKARGTMQSTPGFKTKLRMEPVQFDTSATGSLELAISPISAKMGEIPIRLAIPFMKPRRAIPVVMSLGGFSVKFDRFKINVQGASVDLGGTIGTKGVAAEVDCDVTCRTEMEVAGQVPLKLGSIRVNLAEEEHE